MIAPTPQSESVNLANEAKYLPLEAHERRVRLLWRLRGLVRKSPSDEVARLGLMFAALHSGDRITANEQLSWLSARPQSLETAILMNIAAPQVMIGDFDNARSVLEEIARRPDRPYLDMGQPETDAVWALLVGDSDLAWRLAQGYPAAQRFLAEAERRHLNTPITLLGAAAAETIGPVACDLSLEMNASSKEEGAFLCCVYRIPNDRNKRKQILRSFDKLWCAKLSESNLEEIDFLGEVMADVLPLPTPEPLSP